MEEQARESPGIVLWDYKTTRKPDPGKEMQYYRWQMDLYALLYQRTFGVRPQGTVLYFMGELNHPRLAQRPESAVLHLPVDEQQEQHTLDLLRWAVEQEMRCQESGQWKAPTPDQVPQRLCQPCLIRWSCPSVHFSFPWEHTAQQEKS
ncbi:MAG: PD-(D/E)XK nuclease family protein [Ktedonobacteraceae bacterium]